MPIATINRLRTITTIIKFLVAEASHLVWSPNRGFNGGISNRRISIRRMIRRRRRSLSILLTTGR